MSAFSAEMTSARNHHTDSSNDGADGMQTCRTALEEIGVIETASEKAPPHAQYERHSIAPEIGQGWLDFYQVNHGVLVARSQYELHPQSCMNAHLEGAPGYFALAWLQSGTASWQHKGIRQRERIPNGTAMLCPSGTMRKNVAYEWQEASPFSGICVLVPNALMMELMADAGRIKPDRLVHGETALLMDRQQASYQQTMQAMHLLMQSAPITTVGRLQMESLALGMVALLARQDEHLEPWLKEQRLPYRQRIAVEEACQILHTEFAAAHTIASLARRVHLNECYLKSAFRLATGQTIAAYLRAIRMEKARELIEGGQMNVLQACLFVGYANQSMFSAAFRAHYGFSPSKLK